MQKLTSWQGLSHPGRKEAVALGRRDSSAGIFWGCDGGPLDLVVC